MPSDRRWNAAPFPPGHCDRVDHLAFSPDGKQLATGGQDGVLRVWSVNSGTLCSAFDARGGWWGIRHLAWTERTRGQDMIVHAGPGVRRWRSYLGGNGGERLKGLVHPDDVRGRWSVGGALREPHRLEWFDTTLGRVMRTTPAAPESVSAWGWRLGPGGDTIMAIVGDELVSFNPLDWSRVGAIPLPELTADLDGRGPGRFAISDEGTVGYTSPNGWWVRAPVGPWVSISPPDGSAGARADEAVALAITADGRTLAMSTHERRVHLVDVARLAVARSLPRTAAGIDVVWSADGARVYVLVDGVGVVAWDLASRLRVAIHRMPRAFAESRPMGLVDTELGLAVVSLQPAPTKPRHPSREHVHATAEVSVWDVVTDTPTFRLPVGTPASSYPSLWVAWPWIVCGNNERANPGSNWRIRAWDGRTGERVLNVGGLPGTYPTFAVDNGTVVCATRGVARIFDLVTGENRSIELAHSFQRVPQAISPDGRRIVWDDGCGRTLRVVDHLTGEVAIVMLPSDGAHCCAFSPDGARLAVTRGYDRGVALWQVGESRSRELEGHRGIPQVVAFSPDGRRIATTGNDGQVIVWSAATTRRLAVLPALGD